MRIYAIALLLITIGCINGCINEMGFLPNELPEHGVGLSDTQAEELKEGAFNEDVNALSVFTIMSQIGGIIFEGLKAAVTVIPLLTAWGVPLAMATMIQAPIWFVYAFDILQFVTARSSKSMD